MYGIGLQNHSGTATSPWSNGTIVTPTYMGGGAEVGKPERPTFTSSALAHASFLILVTGRVTNCGSKVLCSTPSPADSALGCASNDLPCAIHLKKKLPFQHRVSLYCCLFDLGCASSTLVLSWEFKFQQFLYFITRCTPFMHSCTHTYCETMPMTTGQLSNINLALKSIKSFHFFVQERSLTTSGQFWALLVQFPIN